jgi:surface carbohydrate biosynthesis protein
VLIQNGVRHDVSPAAGEGLVSLLRRLNLRERPRVSHYLVFGEPAKALLAPYVDGEFVTTGSYRLNEFAPHRVQTTRRDDAGRRRIGFIASFPRICDLPGGRILGNDTVFVRVAGRPVTYADYFGVDAVVLRLLAEVAVEKGIKLSVIGKRSSEESPEAIFFAGSPGCEAVEVIAHAPGNGYRVADDFDWLVTVDSTLGYEMLALGHKVAFVSNRFRMLGIDSDEMRFAHPLPLATDGPFWTSATDEGRIRAFLAEFLDVGETQWNDARESTVARLMHLDAGNLTLRRLLRSEIGRTR